MGLHLCAIMSFVLVDLWPHLLHVITHLLLPVVICMGGGLLSCWDDPGAARADETPLARYANAGEIVCCIVLYSSSDWSYSLSE